MTPDAGSKGSALTLDDLLAAVRYRPSDGIPIDYRIIVNQTEMDVLAHAYGREEAEKIARLYVPIPPSPNEQPQ